MAVRSRLQGGPLPVRGLRVATVKAGIRKADRRDLVVIELAEGSRVAGVFTRNAFCAAPVQIARQHLADTPVRYLLINTGNANAGTGARGLADAMACCHALAEQVEVAAEAVLPFSTGVIGEYLPVDRIVAALPRALDSLQQDGWQEAALGIMTTDTRPKAGSRQFQSASGLTVTLTGIAKGAGMIKPDMATMLAFLATDADIEDRLLQQLLKQSVNQSFNRITVDGDTSTNDSCILAATGASGVKLMEGGEEFAAFAQALDDLMRDLAMEIIRDAEGASKFVTIRVEGGASTAECLSVAYAIAESPLVKTALFASDPNWGRILAAIGRAGVKDLSIDRIAVSLSGIPLVESGALSPRYTEAKGQAVMNQEEIDITVNLSRGSTVETVWTSDLSHDYVRINAEYRT